MRDDTCPALVIALSLLTAGCVGDGKPCASGVASGCEGEHADPDEYEGTGESAFAAVWTALGVTIDLENGQGTYRLGLAETDPSSDDPWTGEDCYKGYWTEDGDHLLYCHPLSATGGSFWYGGDPNDLDEDTETALSWAKAEVVTYYVSSDRTGECWVWGHDPDYYASLGCLDMDSLE